MMTLSMAVCGGQIVGASESSDENLVYGTATLTYSEFYAGDVSSVESYDAVSSATFSKYEIMPNMDTDFVDETSNADGYHIIGVKNVSVAVAESDLEAYQALNPTFVAVENEPQQYKLVTMEDGTAVYSETQFNVADTVTDATAELVTGGTWGDYQINVTDGETVHLRNSREDEFDINSEIQGIILETASGLKVGMEYLQSIWVQPYEVSFNVLDDNSHNTHIAAYDNLDELSKLVGETVVKITYIMPEETYVYEFDGIYIKPIYSEAITATTAEDFSSVTLSADNFDAFDNGTLTVNYTLGSGRDRQIITLLETALVNGASEYAVDLTALSDAETGGIYSAVISSDSYADIVVSLPASQEQKEALEALVSTAQEKLNEDAQNTTLEEHMNEAQEMLENEAVSSSEMGSLISELTQLTSDEEEQERSGH
jgi:hypothetical protein